MPSSGFEISAEDRVTLESWTRSQTIPAGQVQRARIVLAVAEGAGTTATADRVGVTRPTVIKWRDRYAERGIAGLVDQPRPGRPKIIDDRAIIAPRWIRHPRSWGSLIGPRGCWADSSESLMPPSPAPGAGTVSNRGGGKPSSSPPILNCGPRSKTSSDSTFARRRRRSRCVWTRSPRSKR